MPKNLVVGLNHGAEIEPTLAALRAVYPSETFTVERSFHGTMCTSAWAIYVGGAGAYDARGLDHMRHVGTACRDGFAKGYRVGWNDHAKHGPVRCQQECPGACMRSRPLDP
jgi:hypothetical protein